ncbi:hypothetical protein [Ammoniphilus sp. YIM 78166]|nr:hypothetical protein [Ammoniphilus sp. YIM 78166]
MNVLRVSGRLLAMMTKPRILILLWGICWSLAAGMYQTKSKGSS